MGWFPSKAQGGVGKKNGKKGVEVNAGVFFWVAQGVGQK